MATRFAARKCKLKGKNDERILLIGNGKCLGVCTSETKHISTSATFPPKKEFSTSNNLLEPLEQVLIVNDKNVIRLKDTNRILSVAASSPQNLLPRCLVPKLNRYFLDICYSAILYREQIVQLFQQRPPSKVVPKRIQLIGNNGTFKGASISQNIIHNAEINVAAYGRFSLFVTIDQDRKQLVILMWQKDQSECPKPKFGNNEDDENDLDNNTKFLCKHLSKTVHNLARLYHVLNTQNSKKPRPWAMSANQNVANSNKLSTSKIINGKLLDKVCNFNDQFTISINFKEYRLGRARVPHKPKISITMESN